MEQSNQVGMEKVKLLVWSDISVLFVRCKLSKLEAIHLHKKVEMILGKKVFCLWVVFCLTEIVWTL